jgi:hypothetical protein
MRSADAIAAGVAMLRDPHLAQLARRRPLPKGMTLLLEVASGETEALAAACSMTGRSEATVQKAAGFFIEQVLLNRQGDYYRVLGLSRDALPMELRRHMALMMKWLHPDLFSAPAEGMNFSRSAYVGLVTEAWETLKTRERRAAYDAVLMQEKRISWHGGLNGGGVLPGKTELELRALPSRSAGRRLALHRIERGGFWSRLKSYIGIFG